MDSARERIRLRIAKSGLRTICEICRRQGRHFPAKGRLRTATCGYCGHEGTLRSLAWAEKNPARFLMASRERREGQRPLSPE